MTSRKQRLRILPSLLLALTVPVLAMLCRGHSPSRYDLPNLPVWERQPPPSAKIRAYAAQTTLSQGAVRLMSSTAAASLPAADDTLFSVLDSGAGAAVDRQQAGAPGAWLEIAAQLSVYAPQLQPRVNQVTLQLLGRQTAEGYLGPPKAVHRYSTGDIAAHAQNIIGLLCGYAATRNPAILYGAISAGHFVLQNYDPPRRSAATRSDSTIAEALAQLYLLTSDGDFLTFARREGEKSRLSGAALCSLYEATGEGTYLERARKAWSAGDRSAQLGAKMFLLTGDQVYLTGASDRATDPAWRAMVAFTQCGNTLRINDLQPAEVRWKDMTIAVTRKDSHITCAIVHASAVARGIQVLMPACRASGNPGKAAAVQLRYWTGRRIWKAGDRISLPSTNSCGPPIVVPCEKVKQHSPART